MSMLGKQIDGIWHTGIVVYGKVRPSRAVSRQTLQYFTRCLGMKSLDLFIHVFLVNLSTYASRSGYAQQTSNTKILLRATTFSRTC